MPLLFLALIVLSGCSTIQYKSPEDYYRDRSRNNLKEDSINWGPNTNNNMLNSPDGSTYYNRTVEVFGATY